MSEKAYDIAMVGDVSAVMLAKAAGMGAFGTDSAEEASKTITQLAKAGTKVIFVTERIYAQCTEVIDRYKTVAYPAIIPVPDSQGSTNLAMSVIKANVEKAIGTDIIFAEENK